MISQLDFDRPACPANLKSRNRTTKTEPIGGVRKSVQPKLDFAARFHSLISQPDSDRPACSADPKSRNRTTETEQTGGEGRSACRSPISQPRFRPPRVFRRPEEPEQNYGNGTNRRRSTLCLPKPDFAPSISTASRVPPTRRAETEPRKRNKPEVKDALPAEARFRNPISTASRVPPT